MIVNLGKSKNKKKKERKLNGQRSRYLQNYNLIKEIIIILASDQLGAIAYKENIVTNIISKGNDSKPEEAISYIKS